MLGINNKMGYVITNIKIMCLGTNACTYVPTTEWGFRCLSRAVAFLFLRKVEWFALDIEGGKCNRFFLILFKLYMYKIYNVFNTWKYLRITSPELVGYVEFYRILNCLGKSFFFSFLYYICDSSFPNSSFSSFHNVTSCLHHACMT